jgi:hypothetical protein
LIACRRPQPLDPRSKARIRSGVTPSAGLPWTRGPWSTVRFMAASAPTSAAQPTTARHIATHHQIHRRQPPFCTIAPAVSKYIMPVLPLYKTHTDQPLVFTVKPSAFQKCTPAVQGPLFCIKDL